MAQITISAQEVLEKITDIVLEYLHCRGEELHADAKAEKEARIGFAPMPARKKLLWLIRAMHNIDLMLLALDGVVDTTLAAPLSMVNPPPMDPKDELALEILSLRDERICAYAKAAKVGYTVKGFFSPYHQKVVKLRLELVECVHKLAFLRVDPTAT